MTGSTCHMQDLIETPTPLADKIIGLDMMHKICLELGLMTQMVGIDLLMNFDFQSSGDGPIEWTVGAFHDDSRGKENPNVQWQYHASDIRSRAIADYLWGYWWGYEDPTQLGIDVYGNGNVHYNGSQLRWDDTETAYFGEASYTMDLQDG